MLPRVASTYSDDNVDIARIHHVTGRLRITEFELFQRAHHEWFGHAAEEKALERVYVAYMFNQAVPHWVRHFCRRFLSDTAATAPPAPAAEHWDGDHRRTFAAVALAAALAVSVMILVVRPIIDTCAPDESGVPRGPLNDAVSQDASLPAC
jgi:hypothetical protein